MTDHPPPNAAVTSLDAVLYDWMTAHPASDLAAASADKEALASLLSDLRNRLIAREDNIADHLRLAGAQFGALPEFVAEVVCQTGLGTEVDHDQRLLIHQQFHDRLDQMKRDLAAHLGIDPSEIGDITLVNPADIEDPPDSVD